jgi:hypothetical protein
VAAAAAVVITMPLVGFATPVAADGGSSGSAIGDGALSSPANYVDATMDTDPGIDVQAGEVQDDACQTVTGAVSEADKGDYKGRPPQGDGAWEYQLCAKDGPSARSDAAANPDVASAKRFCAAPANDCAVFVYWRPNQQPKSDAQIKGRLGYFDSFFRFAPDLQTSPSRNPQYGLVVNFPAWFWDRTNSAPKAIVLPIFGGITGVAIHLGTTWRTDGRQICSTPGTVYDPGRYPPTAQSPDCGYIYRDQKRADDNDITGCKTWLIIAYRPLFFLIVFPITLCRTWNVPVLESQIVTGGYPARARVGVHDRSASHAPPSGS